jgi:hypothetical protein
MLFILLFLNATSYETTVDTVKFYLRGEEHISLKKALKKENPNFTGVPSWLVFDLSEKLSELRYSPVVFPAAKAIGIRESTRSETEYIFLEGSSLFIEEDNTKKLLASHVHSFNLVNNEIIYADDNGEIYDGKGKKIGSFEPPVDIGGGDELGIRDGKGDVYIRGGFISKKFRRLKGKRGVPFTIDGRQFFFDMERINLPGGTVLSHSLPVASIIRNVGEGLVWCDRNGGVFWTTWTGSNWDFPDNITPSPLLPDLQKIAPSLFFFSPDSFIAISIEGKPQLYRKKENGWYSFLLTDESYPYATILISNGNCYLGYKNGAVYRVSKRNLERIELIDSVSSYASIANFKGEIIIASGEGKIKGFRKDIQLIPPVRIAAGKFNSDEEDDLIASDGRGRVHLFLSPDYQDDTLSFPLLSKFLSPSVIDFNRDGVEDAILSGLDGNLYLFLNRHGKFEEGGNWKLEPMQGIKDIEEYYGKYYPAGEPLLKEDNFTLKILTEFLDSIPTKFKDEVAFVIAHLPTNVLRAIIGLGDTHLLLSNAVDVYRAAEILPYVEVVEEKNFTTLLYEGKYKLPRYIYYYYVVHPRILYEIPSMIDASYWRRDWKYYGIEYEEWLQKEIDIYKGEKKEFWRDIFFHDSLFGETIFDGARDANTLRKAILNLYRFQSWAYEGNRMRFGYKTQDIQPLQIYYKSYGSCGEQSILFTALMRTLLIPSYIVASKGEDHQWNHFWYPGEWSPREKKWNNWHHLDINGRAEDYIGNPYISALGLKKYVSTVIGWRPDGYHFPVTQAGYTNTGELKLKIVDRNKKPIPGALAVIRSHWKNRNMVSTWGYTDLKGLLHFNLGYEPLGYTIDVLSPFGTGGRNLFWIEEGEKKELEIKLPGETKGIKHPEVGIQLPDSTRISVRGGFLRGFNFITSTPYRIKSSYLKDSIQYAGTGIERIPISQGKVTIEEKDGTLYLYNPIRNITSLVELYITHRRINEPPRLLVSPKTLNLYSGSKDTLHILAHDNLGIKTLSMEFGKRKQVLSLDESEILFDAGKGGPLYPGQYKLLITAEDFNGNRTKQNIGVNILPSYSFTNQRIYQDKSPDSLPEGSWIFGPLYLSQDIPFMFLLTDSKERDVDIDMFVYRDNDGNGYPTNDERVGSGTGPTDREEIFFSYPKKGTYWIYINGCSIPREVASFNFYCSFTIDSTGCIAP